MFLPFYRFLSYIIPYSTANVCLKIVFAKPCVTIYGKAFFLSQKKLPPGYTSGSSFEVTVHSTFYSSCSHTFYQLILENNEHDDHRQKSQCQDSHDHRCIHRILALEFPDCQRQGTIGR